MKITVREKFLASIAVAVIAVVLLVRMFTLQGGENVDLNAAVNVVTSKAAVSVIEAMTIPEAEAEAALENSSEINAAAKQEPVYVTSQGIIIPTESIIYKDGKQLVIVVEKGDKPVYQEVETGIRTKERVEILKGLEEGQTYIIEGQLYVKENSTLVIKNE